eukprot:750115-Rhodomonas_salina.1
MEHGQELCEGIRRVQKSPGLSQLSRDNFEILTANGALCNAAGDLNAVQFKEMMKRQLRVYVQRQVRSGAELIGHGGYGDGCCGTGAGYGATIGAVWYYAYAESRPAPPWPSARAPPSSPYGPQRPRALIDHLRTHGLFPLIFLWRTRAVCTSAGNMVAWVCIQIGADYAGDAADKCRGYIWATHTHTQVLAMLRMTTLTTRMSRHTGASNAQDAADDHRSALPRSRGPFPRFLARHQAHWHQQEPSVLAPTAAAGPSLPLPGHLSVVTAAVFVLLPARSLALHLYLNLLSTSISSSVARLLGCSVARSLSSGPCLGLRLGLLRASEFVWVAGGFGERVS